MIPHFYSPINKMWDGGGMLESLVTRGFIIYILTYSLYIIVTLYIYYYVIESVCSICIAPYYQKIGGDVGLFRKAL